MRYDYQFSDDHQYLVLADPEGRKKTYQIPIALFAQNRPPLSASAINTFAGLSNMAALDGTWPKVTVNSLKRRLLCHFFKMDRGRLGNVLDELRTTGFMRPGPTTPKGDEWELLGRDMTPDEFDRIADTEFPNLVNALDAQRLQRIIQGIATGDFR
jgi:hypothetical protein